METKRQKSGGRRKGTPNKVTSELRQWVCKLVDDNRAQIVEDLKVVGPERRLAIFEKFMQYIIPKRQQVRADIDNLSDSELSQLAKTILIQLGYDEN